MVLQYLLSYSDVSSNPCGPDLVQNRNGDVEPIKLVLVRCILTLVEVKEAVLGLIEAMCHMLLSFVAIWHLLDETKEYWCIEVSDI